MSEEATIEFSAASKELGDKIAGLTLKEARESVSYTHLTLPTIYSV